MGQLKLMKKALLVLALASPASAQYFPGGGGSGAGISACSTTPPSTGTAGQTCYDTSGAIWVCHPSGACSTSGDWVSQGTSGALTLGSPSDWSAATAYSANQVVQYSGSSYVAVASSTGVVPGTDSTKWKLLAAQGANGQNGTNGAPGAPGYNPNAIISGGTPVWTGTGYVYNVPATSYFIQNVPYSTAATQKTLASADPTNDRIDVIYVDDSSAVGILQGTAAVSPVKPAVDPAHQLELSFIYVPAGSSAPSNVTNTLLYDEDVGASTEWNATSSGTGWTLASTSSPYHGSKCILASNVSSGYVQLKIGSGTVTVGGSNNLVFVIESTGAWSKRSLTMALFSGSTQKGVGVTLADSQFAFTSSLTSAYQQIVVPLNLFGALGQTFDTIRWTVAGSGSGMGFRLDYVYLQSGVTTSFAPSGLTWQGVWNSTVSYAVNSVVTYLGVTYVALASNTNSTPSATNTNWAAVAAPLHAIPFVFDGGGQALQIGKTIYYQIPFPCTIKDWHIGSTTAETITVKWWKIAAGGSALPTASNSINTSGVSLSTGTKIDSTTLSDFTNLVIAAGDWLAANLTNVSASQQVTAQLGCQ